MASSKAHFTDRRLIYRLEDRVEVCKAFSIELQQYVCLKTLAVRTDADINSVLQETLVQSSLDHPNVCKIYDCFIRTGEAGREAVVVMELMDKDLLTLIQEKRAAGNPWTEDELLEMFGVLIDTFAFIQSKRIVHRDIKPNNILIGPGKVLKVCDFGTSKRIVDVNALHTLRGTQVFMSPVCKEVAMKDEYRLFHDPFKSDVYSLGLTFLSLARLVPPFELIQPGNHLHPATVKTIEKLRYSATVKSLLFKMLSLSEADRPDFISLQRVFRYEPYLQLLNSYAAQGVGDPLELKTAVRFLLNKGLTANVSLHLQCTNCASSEIDLSGDCAKYVFCVCGKHCYCGEACYKAYVQQTGFLPVPKTSAPCLKGSMVKCVFCAVLIPEEPGYVELFCNSRHKFCSLVCLGRFIIARSPGKHSSGDQIRCPLCEVPISEYLLEAAFSGRAHYFSMIKRECMKCHNKKFKFLSSCGHAYCRPCALALKATIQATHEKQWPCDLCGTAITEKEIKSALSMSRSIEKFIDFITS